LLLEEAGWSRRALPGAVRQWRRFFAGLLIWGSAALAVGIALWPALWVEPLQTLYFVLRAMAGHAAKGHEASIYFNGAVIEGDPGLHFYPVTYLWRTTPLVLAGVVLAVVTAVIDKGRFMVAQERRVVFSLALFALLYTLFLSLGAKKWDRYLLPIYPALDLVAALGWLAAGRGLLALPWWLTLLVQLHPYYLSYYNPLLGGTTRAPAMMMVGWGEGLDQAAHFLNSLPNAPSLRAASGIWTGSFSYFFKGHINGTTFDPQSSHVDEWSTSDFLVIYINQWQRGRLSPQLLDYLARLTPVYTVHLQGLEYVRVYDLRQTPPPDYLLEDHKAVELPVQEP
jgi:hypothetical protein